MQRTQNGSVIISCDFCGDDWDQVKSMIEGHRGSVICLACLKKALAGARSRTDRFSCTMCLRDLPATKERWLADPRPDATTPRGVICLDCIHQAAKAFDRDPDVDWKWERSEGSRESGHNSDA